MDLLNQLIDIETQASGVVDVIAPENILITKTDLSSMVREKGRERDQAGTGNRYQKGRRGEGRGGGGEEREEEGGSDSLYNCRLRGLFTRCD